VSISVAASVLASAGVSILVVRYAMARLSTPLAPTAFAASGATYAQIN
jgi:hypothetical protein